LVLLNRLNSSGLWRLVTSILSKWNDPAGQKDYSKSCLLNFFAKNMLIFVRKN